MRHERGTGLPLPQRLGRPAGLDRPYTVTPAAFATQLDRIAAAGLTVVPLHRLVSALRGGAPLPDRSAVLTFDDGFADFFWTVAPLLTERELPAALFVTTGAVRVPGRPPRGSLLPYAPMLNWRQITNLEAFGVEIGGHTRTRPQLDTLGGHHMLDEVAGCKRDLEEALGHEVLSFAYPHGYSSPGVRRQVLKAGWTSACAVSNAFSSTGDDALRIARLMVMADTPPETFEAWTRRRGAPVAPFPERLRTKGWRAYRRLRAGLGRPVGRPVGGPSAA